MKFLFQRVGLYYVTNHWLQQCSRRATLLQLLVLVVIITGLTLVLHQSSDQGHRQPLANAHQAGLTRRRISNTGSLSQASKQNQAYSLDEKSLLALRIEDLNRIKLSLNNELRLLERDKSKLLAEKTTLTSRNERLTTQLARSKQLLKQLELDISSTKRTRSEQACDSHIIAPVVYNPLKSFDIEDELAVASKNSPEIFRNDIDAAPPVNRFAVPSSHPINYSFDLSRCPLTKGFKFSVVDATKRLDQVQVLTDDRSYRTDPAQALDLLESHEFYSNNASEACLVVWLLAPNTSPEVIDPRANNLVVLLQSDELPLDTLAQLAQRAMVAAPVFRQPDYRNRLDLVIPSVLQAAERFDLVMGALPPHNPIGRKYFASYFGVAKGNDLNLFERTLQVIHRNSMGDKFFFAYNCDTETKCYEERGLRLEQSTFVIVPPPSGSYAIDDSTNELVYWALAKGAIPVLMGRERDSKLPFSDLVDWRRASIQVHSSRLPELHFMLRSISPSDTYQLKFHGRHIFERYLASNGQIFDAIISFTLTERFGMTPPPVQDVNLPQYYVANDRQPAIPLDTNCSAEACRETQARALSSSISTLFVGDEILGPREKPFDSARFQRNYSLVLSSTYDLWNHPLLSPRRLYPSNPLDPVPPSDYKFSAADNASGYRPINRGLGGSGSEFSRSLGGDSPNEQFTIVVLNYERRSLLMQTLERLKGLAYLNKVIVVWNGFRNPPTSDAKLAWPDMGVPIEVVRVERNSLNNRFLPFESIKTDAVLSIDDDSPLRQDEIVFGFRIWRESRERIVGFPGRYHAWDTNRAVWMYNSNHSCELSMVLTGGAFIHKYYLYMYTFEMPAAIRQIVDKFMNCEDIAMNFLVAHLTRKPPIKVTSRWTFHCPGCVSSLSEEDSHFLKRHECLNTFASIYGYMPLLNTQFRADSILFKTRLPRDKQKCFRFV